MSDVDLPKITLMTGVVIPLDGVAAHHAVVFDSNACASIVVGANGSKSLRAGVTGLALVTITDDQTPAHVAQFEVEVLDHQPAGTPVTHYAPQFHTVLRVPQLVRVGIGSFSFLDGSWHYIHHVTPSAPEKVGATQYVALFAANSDTGHGDTKLTPWQIMDHTDLTNGYATLDLVMAPGSQPVAVYAVVNYVSGNDADLSKPSLSLLQPFDGERIPFTLAPIMTTPTAVKPFNLITFKVHGLIPGTVYTAGTTPAGGAFQTAGSTHAVGPTGHSVEVVSGAADSSGILNIKLLCQSAAGLTLGLYDKAGSVVLPDTHYACTAAWVGLDALAIADVSGDPMHVAVSNLQSVWDTNLPGVWIGLQSLDYKTNYMALSAGNTPGVYLPLVASGPGTGLAPVATPFPASLGFVLKFAFWAYDAATPPDPIHVHFDPGPATGGAFALIMDSTRAWTWVKPVQVLPNQAELIAAGGFDTTNIYYDPSAWFPAPNGTAGDTTLNGLRCGGAAVGNAGLVEGSPTQAPAFISIDRTPGVVKVRDNTETGWKWTAVKDVQVTGAELIARGFSPANYVDDPAVTYDFYDAMGA